MILNRVSLDLPEVERFERALHLVQGINQLSWSGRTLFKIDVPKDVAGKQCPLCSVENICLGPSCLKFSGKFIFSILYNKKSPFSVNRTLALDQTRDSVPTSYIPGLHFADCPDKPTNWYECL